MRRHDDGGLAVALETNGIMWWWRTTSPSSDNFHSLLHKVATAEGIDVAIMTTYDGPWTFSTNDVGRADMRSVLALPEVLTSANPGDFAGGGRKGSGQLKGQKR